MSGMISGLGARLRASAGASLVAWKGPMAGEVLRTLAQVANTAADLNRWGAQYNGTDETAAVNAFLGAIGTNPVTLRISGKVKISANITFPPTVDVCFERQGGFVGVAGTELIQFQSQIVAGRDQIFSNCVARTTVGATCYPEWWGALDVSGGDDLAAFNSAIGFLKNTGGLLDLDARQYNLSANFNVGAFAYGSSGQRTMIVGRGMATALNMTSAGATCIQVGGYPTSKLQGIVLRDFQITKSVTSTGGVGILLQDTAAARVENVQVAGMIYPIYYKRAVNTYSRKVQAVLAGSMTGQVAYYIDGDTPWAVSTAYAVGDMRIANQNLYLCTTAGTSAGTGTGPTGTGASIADGTAVWQYLTPGGGNASSEWWSCYADASGVTGAGNVAKGFYPHGAYISDLALYECETTYARGLHIDGSQTQTVGNEDIQVINFRADMVPDMGIYAYRLGQSGDGDSMLTIFGGWTDAGTSGSISLILLDTCSGVTVIGHQFKAAQNAANTTHVSMSNCTHYKFIGNTHRNMKYGFQMTGCGKGTIAQDDFYSTQAQAATAFITATGDARSMVNGCIFDGYATNAVIFDATSSGSGIVNCTADASGTITTRFANSATGAIGGANGSTGNNSGI